MSQQDNTPAADSAADTPSTTGQEGTQPSAGQQPPQTPQTPQIPDNLEVPIGVYPDGKAWFVNQTTQESSEKDAAEVLDLIKDPQTLKELKGRLFAIYVAQKLATTADESLIIKDDVGNPVHIENGRAGFTFLAEKPEITNAMKAAIDAVEEDIKTMPELAEAKQFFLALSAQMQQFGLITTPIQFLFKQTCFNWLGKDEINDFIAEIEAEEQTDDTKDQIARLKKGGEMIDNYAKLVANAQQQKAGQQAQTQAQAAPKAPEETIVYRPTAINKDGTVTLLNTNTKEETNVTANDILDIIRKPQKIDILALLTAYVGLKLFEASEKSSALTGDLLQTTLPPRFNPVEVLVDKKPQTFQIPVLHTEAIAEFSLLSANGYKGATGYNANAKIEKILSDLQKDYKDDKQVSGAVKGFVDFIEGYKQIFSLPAEVKYLLTIRRTPAEVDALLETAPQASPEQAVLQTAKAQLDTLIEDSKASIAERDLQNALSKEYTGTILARAAKSDAAHKTWGSINALPKEQQTVAMLQAFSPTAATLFKDVDTTAAEFTTSGKYDPISLAAAQWRNQQTAAIDAALGTASPQEKAAINAVLNAGEMALRKTVLLEIITNDPWITNRKDRVVFKKAIAAIDELDDETASHVDMWLNAQSGYNLRLDQKTAAGDEWIKQQSQDIAVLSLTQQAEETLASWSKGATVGTISAIFSGKSSAIVCERQFAKSVSSANLAASGIAADRLNTILTLGTTIGAQGAVIDSSVLQKTANDAQAAPAPVAAAKALKNTPS